MVFFISLCIITWLFYSFYIDPILSHNRKFNESEMKKSYNSLVIIYQN